MKLQETIYLHFGGKGSGCNPKVGKCGRPKGIEFLEKNYSERLSLQDALAGWSDGAICDVVRGIVNRGELDLDEDAPISKSFVFNVAGTLVEALDNSKETFPQMFRGIVFHGSDDKLRSAFKAGTIFDEPLASFTKDSTVATRFAKTKLRNTKSVIFAVYGARAIDMGGAEKELVSGGRFKVMGVNNYGDETYVILHQMDTFKLGNTK